jgi:hypothetical protein
VHYDFVVPDPTVELGQQSAGLLGDNRPLQVGPGKALDRLRVKGTSRVIHGRSRTGKYGTISLAAIRAALNRVG